MKKKVFGLMLFSVLAGFGQTPVKERDTLQALLDEVHQLRQSIEGMTAASQRVQIALYGLQMQDSAVARAMQRMDSVRSRCSAEETNRQHMAEDVRRTEDHLVSGAIPDGEARELKSRLPDIKSALEIQTAAAQNCQAAQAEASNQLRTDQARLAELQDRIARLDKALEQLSTGGK